MYRQFYWNFFVFLGQSAFFESEKGEESNHIGRPSKRDNAIQSVPVEGDEGGGVSIWLFYEIIKFMQHFWEIKIPKNFFF